MAQVRAQTIERLRTHGQDDKKTHERHIWRQYEIESCCEEMTNAIQESTSEATARPRPDSSADESSSSSIEDENGDGDKEESGPAKVQLERKPTKETGAAATYECTCSEFLEKLRINIRKKTDVRRSSRSHSPEVTHTIRIAMKCQGQRERQPVRKQKRRFNTPDLPGARRDAPELQPIAVQSPSTALSCCQGLNLALEFNLNCSGLQLTSRNLSLRPLVAVDLDQH